MGMEKEINRDELTNEIVLLSHIGAGVHCKKRLTVYKELFRESANKLEVWGVQRDLIEVLKRCSLVLEQSEWTNTGYGSLLNVKGQVECDGSVLKVLDSKVNQLAVTGSKQSLPISHLITILKDQLELNEFGITRPVFLVDQDCHNKELISPLALERFQHFSKLMNHEVQDTIGVIVATRDQCVSGASSGGNMFKPPGRIGPAAIIGAAHYIYSYESVRVLLLASGNGEDILTMDLCRFCCIYIATRLESWPSSYTELLHELIALLALQVNLKAVDSDLEPILYVGVFGLIQLLDKQIVVMYHSTESMVASYTYKGITKTIFSEKLKLRKFAVYERLLV